MYKAGPGQVRLSAERLATDIQRYSLVVNGAIKSMVGDGAGARTLLVSSSSHPSKRGSSGTSADLAFSSAESVASSSWLPMVFLIDAVASMVASACSA